MFFLKYLLNYLRRHYRVERGMEYVEALRHLNRPSEVTIPNELIPAGVLMQLRGLLNLHVLSVNSDWVWPYWMERQSDPHDASFIPRAMSFTYINLTHRNWTAVGVLGGRREAIVDPRGAVTPWQNGWSLDTWVEVAGQLYFPSRLHDEHVSQELVEGLPWVRTTCHIGPMTLRTENWAFEMHGREWVAHWALLKNNSSTPQSCSLVFALRPTNPEGISIVRRLSYSSRGFWLVGDEVAAFFPERPLSWHLSNHRRGDCARLYFKPGHNEHTTTCGVGLANACVVYPTRLRAGQTFEQLVIMPIEPANPRFFPFESLRTSEVLATRNGVRDTWQAKLKAGLQVDLPDARYQQCFDANRAFLLLLNDGHEITAGPFTYHRHWFRDAAYMLSALARLGYHQEVAQVLSFYPLKQWKNGYFCSQKGEWDSTGQAIWSILEHYRLTHDVRLLKELYPAIRRGAQWIEKKRHDVTVTKAKPHGLMPAGFSAEHLGPNDFYYWDNFWSLKGLEDATDAAEVLGERIDVETFRRWAADYRRDILHAIQHDVEHSEIHALPAAPGRPPDAGMIGNICAAYPLKLFPLESTPWLQRTVSFIRNHLFHADGFYQEMIHSGINSYLTLQMAQCLIQMGDPGAFRLIEYMLELASPTWCWPEAIHPRTGGGCMGDGHHGWAAAEWVLLVRSLLLDEADRELHLLRLVPFNWVAEGKRIVVQDAPTYFGNVTYSIKFSTKGAKLTFSATWRETPATVVWHLPHRIKRMLRAPKETVCSDRAVKFLADQAEILLEYEKDTMEQPGASEANLLGLSDLPHRNA